MVEEYLVGTVMALARRIAAGRKTKDGTSLSMQVHGRVLLDEEIIGNQHAVTLNVGTAPAVNTANADNVLFGAKTTASSRFEALRAMVMMLSEILLERANTDLGVVEEARKALATLTEPTATLAVTPAEIGHEQAPPAVPGAAVPEGSAALTGTAFQAGGVTIKDTSGTASAAVPIVVPAIARPISPPVVDTTPALTAIEMGRAAFVPRDPTGLPGPWTRVRRSDGSDAVVYEMRWWANPNGADGLFEVRVLGADPNPERLSAAYVRAQFTAVPMNAAGEFIETAGS